MNRKWAAAWVAVMTCWTWCAAAAELPMRTPLYQQWILHRTTFAIVGGRVVNSNGNGWLYGIPRQVSSDGPVRETVTFNGNGATGSIVYSYQRSKSVVAGQNAARHKEIALDFQIEVNSEGRFVLRYLDKDEPKNFFELSQLPGQPVKLSLPPADKPRIIEAPTIWHLLIIHDEECRQKFLPTLEALRGDWQLARTASAAEDELVKLAALAQKQDRAQWARWVEQLADPVYTRRDHADKKLREAGPVVLGYLTRLKMDRLDAEQQFRVRGIIRALSTQQGEDTPESIAATLIGDPYVWLALLSRGDLATRQAAVQQLEVIVGGPVKVDPKADPATQASAREELRMRLEKTFSESGAGQGDAETKPR